MSEIENIDTSEIEHLQINEEDGQYEGSILINPKLFWKIQKEDLDLVENANMIGKKERFTKILKKFNKKENIIYYGKRINEKPIDIAEIQGNIGIQLISKKIAELKRNLKNQEHRRKIWYIHIGAVQVLIKVTFQEGINSHIELILKDNRINDSRDKILGVIEGNLAYVKLKFEIRPNIGIPLNTQGLDQVLTLEHKFLRENLMRPGDKIFSITYYVNYALTNSHHSITFRNNDRIDISRLFEDIGKIYYPKKNEITELGIVINRPRIVEIESITIPKPITLLEPERTNEENDIYH